MTTVDGQPWDLYREIHKAMRLALFGVTTQAGATDPASPAAVDALAREWADVRFVLDGHHAHEDEHCDPLVVAHAPDLRDQLEAAHHESDAALDAIDAQVAALTSAPAGERGALLQALHLALADFTAAYLEHLRFEEAQVMPRLNAAVPDEALAATTEAIRGSVPPDDMCTFIRYMVPSMHLAERVDMLGGMHAGAPPEIFERFRAAAEGCLPEDEYRQVAEAGGFA